MGGASSCRRTENFTLIEGSCFAASPAGTTNRADYEFMRDEILAQVKAALPLDGVLLGLHGAMVAHGYDDTEGDVIEHVRALVGAGLRDRRRTRPALPSHAEARAAAPTSSSCIRSFRTPTSWNAPRTC